MNVASVWGRRRGSLVAIEPSTGETSGLPSGWREIARDVLPPFILTRGLFAILTVLTPLWRAATGTPPLRLVRATGTILDAWNRWDVRWYDDLARLGYNLRGPEGFKNVAFFPLFPLLMRTFHDGWALVARGVVQAHVVPDYPPYLIAGMIVSNLCAFGALNFLYLLVRLDNDRAAARRSTWLLACCPSSIFLGAAYSESTFLLSTIAFFYVLRRGQWWQAGLWGLLSTAARAPGAVLVVPFILAWVDAHPVAVASLRDLLRRGRAWIVERRSRSHAAALLGPGAREGANGPPTPAILLLHPSTSFSVPVHDAESQPTPLHPSLSFSSPVHGVQGVIRLWLGWSREARQAVRNGMPIVVIPLGLLLFMAFLGAIFGNPLWFSVAEKAWWRTFAPPWETLAMSLLWPLGDLVRARLTAVDLFAFHDLVYEVVGLTVTVLAWKRLWRPLSAYTGCVWLIILSSPAILTERRTGEPHHDVLMSLPRLLLMLFPLFIYLGLRPRLFRPLLAAFLLGLILYTEIFLTGGWLS